MMSDPEIDGECSDLFNLTHQYDEYIFCIYNDVDSGIPLEEVIPAGFVYVFTLLLGVVGNALVIFCIVRHKGMRSITNIFLLSLATADLMLVLICVPVKGIAFFSFSWTTGKVMCKLVHYVQNVSMICSVMTLTMMSIERYVAIRYPLKAKYLCTLVHAKVVIFSVWSLSFILAVPILFGQKLVEGGVLQKGYTCIKEWPDPIYKGLYELYMLIIMLIIPTGVMIVAYTGICWEMITVTARRADMRSGSLSETTPPSEKMDQTRKGVFKGNRKSSSQTKTKKKSAEDDKTKMQVVKMLVVVVFLFVLCWAPILINNVLVGFNILPLLHYGSLKPMRMTFHLLSYFNSCINPVVYSFMSRNFRESFKQTFRNLCCGKRPLAEGNTRYTRVGTMSFATRTTSVNRSRKYQNRTDSDKVDQSNSSSDNVKITLAPPNYEDVEAS